MPPWIHSESPQGILYAHFQEGVGGITELKGTHSFTTVAYLWASLVAFTCISETWKVQLVSQVHGRDVTWYYSTIGTGYTFVFQKYR